jgi:predicted ATPase
LKKLFDYLSLLSKDKLEIEKNLILETLQTRAKIITNLIPGSKAILGDDLPEIMDLPSENDEQNRFMKTIIDLICIFASGGRCLSLFLDDLQWADYPSLLLIQRLLNMKNVRIFIIGSYRDNEVSSTHPIMTIIQPVLVENNMKTIHLENLKLEHVEEFLGDSLNSNDKDLAELIFQKTNGNPFFMKEFISFV